MKLMYEVPDNQAGEVTEREPTETGGPTLSEALAAMEPSLAVEPVEDSEILESEAEPVEPAPGDEVAEEEETAPGTEEIELEAEVEPEVEAEVEEVEEEVEEPELVEGDDTFTLTLGEVELELEVEDDSTRAALEKMQNDLGRVKDVETMVGRVQGMAEQVAANRNELDAIEDELKLDPVGYITERVHPTIQHELIKEMLYDDDALKMAEDLIGAWLDDPASRREQAADAKVKRVERKQEAQTSRQRQVEERKNAQAVWTKVMEMTPEDMDHATAKMWHQDAMAEIRSHVQASNIETLNPDDLPRVLAGRMRLYGIGDNAGRKKPAQPTDERGKKLASEQGERFKKKVARRRQAASAPTGAGGAPGRTQLPKGATLDDALKSLRERVGR